MHPADFYELARRDREGAARHLLCYDEPGLRRFAAECAHHLYERFEVRVPEEHIIHTWQHVALLNRQQKQLPLALWERAVGQ